ncbi:rRNA N-glycosidase [Striga asiatica]|uniref:rRNA N-glycosylase n=1 Tax=Striga asiatica TaxID=4170 RepID=A0A5A7QS29_STRAF|nr:rRNA N-glycosidase [Striga asiatica]
MENKITEIREFCFCCHHHHFLSSSPFSFCCHSQLTTQRWKTKLLGLQIEDITQIREFMIRQHFPANKCEEAMLAAGVHLSCQRFTAFGDECTPARSCQPTRYLWVFRDDIFAEPLMRSIFPRNRGNEIPCNLISFDPSYVNLQQFSGINRSNIKLGVEGTAAAVSSLFLLERLQKARNKIISKAFLVLIPFISEAARIKKLNEKLGRIAQPEYGVYRSCTQTGYDKSCQNNWGAMSDRANSCSNLTDPFSPVVQLNGDPITDGHLIVDTAGKVKEILQTLKAPRHEGYSPRVPTAIFEVFRVVVGWTFSQIGDLGQFADCVIVDARFSCEPRPRV